MTERPLPAAIDAERLVLGSVALGEELPALEASDFALESHRLIYRAMSELSGAGTAIDRATVAQRLRDTGKLEAVGGISYLVELDNELPKIYNLDAYTRTIREKAILRRAVLAAQSLTDELLSPGATRDAIERATAFLSALSVANSESPFLNAEEILDRAGGFDALLRPPTGVKLPAVWPKLAGVIPALQPGELWVVGGRPSRGKSMFGMLLSLYAAQAGIGTSIHSLEMPDGRIFKRALAAVSGVSFGRISKGGNALEPSHRQEIQSAAAQIAEWPWWVADKATPTVKEIRAAISEAGKRGRKVGLVVIDYLQLVNGKGENANARVSGISRGLKLLAMDLGIPVVALSQLSRPPKAAPEWKPGLQDLRDSGSIEQDADGVIFVHATDRAWNDARQAQGPMVGEIDVAKQRDGPLMAIPALFDGKYMRITEAA